MLVDTAPPRRLFMAIGTRLIRRLVTVGGVAGCVLLSLRGVVSTSLAEVAAVHVVAKRVEGHINAAVGDAPAAANVENVPECCDAEGRRNAVGIDGGMDGESGGADVEIARWVVARPSGRPKSSAERVVNGRCGLLRRRVLLS